MHKRIDNILEMLKDGKWHTIKEISQQCKLGECRIEALVNFLSKFSFLELNKKQKKAKLSRAFTEFLKKIQTFTEP